MFRFNKKSPASIARKYILIALSFALLTGCSDISIEKIEDFVDEIGITETTDNTDTADTEGITDSIASVADIPDFDGETYDITVNNNKTYFTDEELADTTLEDYSEMDSLGRCGPAVAYISQDTITSESRGSIGQIKPSGWHTVRYDDLISDKYLYNRCHLVGFQFIGNSTNNENNLITGTRYFNADEDHGMLHYEMKLRNYLNASDLHVKYRVTPIFEGNNLVAKGVLMEAQTVEDDGEEFEFCVFIYNEQPGITIDHATGDSHVQTDEELTALKEN